MVHLLDTEDIILGKTKFTTIDLGGHATGLLNLHSLLFFLARRVWKDYYEDIDAIIFLVDAADETRFDEAREELQGLLSDESIANVPIAVLGNKIDAPGAVHEDSLRQKLGIYENSGYSSSGKTNTRPMKLFMCSIINQAGYDVAFKWINERIK